MTDGFKVEFELHRGSALSPFSFTIVMDRLTDEVSQEPLWTMMFADSRKSGEVDVCAGKTRDESRQGKIHVCE